MSSSGAAAEQAVEVKVKETSGAAFVLGLNLTFKKNVSGVELRLDAKLVSDCGRFRVTLILVQR